MGKTVHTTTASTNKSPFHTSFNVQAQASRNVIKDYDMPNIRLNIELRDDNGAALWVCVIDIPVIECERLARFPLKWLRYVAFTIYGIKSHLSRSEQGEPVNYEATTAIEGDYFYIAQRPPRLIDVRAFDERTTVGNSTRQLQSSFRKDVINRDGAMCLFLRETADIQACHIIPHSKGDDYMEVLFSQRGGTDNEDDSAEVSSHDSRPRNGGNRNAVMEEPDGKIDVDTEGLDSDDIDDESDESGGTVGPPEEGIHDIDDVRNGLVLWIDLHNKMKFGQIGFMRTPNFALDNDDISRLQEAPPNESGRFILHHFVDFASTASLVNRMTPNNCDGHEAQNESQRPPSFILDAWYGSCIVQKWCPEASEKCMREMGKPIYYAGKAGAESTDAEDFEDRPAREQQDTDTKVTSQDSGTTNQATKQVDRSDWTREQALDFLSLISQLACPRQAPDRPSSRERRLLKKRQKREKRAVDGSIRKVSEWLGHD